MPWRFKSISWGPLSTEADEEDNQNASKPVLDSPDDKMTSDLDLESSALGQETQRVATEHHQYYRQHLRSLRRLVHKAGGVGKKDALVAVSRSRRFSLPEPKPDYEYDDFDGAVGKCFQPFFEIVVFRASPTGISL